MKFIHLADLHIGKRVNAFPMLEDQRYILKQILTILREEQPDGGVILAGDIYDKAIPSAEAVELFDEFLTRLAALQIRVFIIAGNHDFCLRGASLEGLDDNCHYLCNSGVLIEGVKFYGVPMFFEDAVTGRSEDDFMNIPADTDVLVTHQPPEDILDLSDEIHYGNPVLWQRVMQVCPKYHLFGHIHKAAGVETRNGTVFSNGAVLGEGYNLTDTDICVLTI